MFCKFSNLSPPISANIRNGRSNFNLYHAGAVKYLLDREYTSSSRLIANCQKLRDTVLSGNKSHNGVEAMRIQEKFSSTLLESYTSLCFSATRCPRSAKLAVNVVLPISPYRNTNKKVQKGRLHPMEHLRDYVPMFTSNWGFQSYCFVHGQHLHFSKLGHCNVEIQ